MAECFVGNSIQGVSGAKFRLTDSLYRWTYGTYKNNITWESNAFVAETSSSGTSYQPSAVGYRDITFNGDGTVTFSNYETHLYVNGLYSISGLKNINLGVYGNGTTSMSAPLQVKVCSGFTATSTNNGYFNYSGYYTVITAGWITKGGYILSNDINAYPNGGYLNGIYYGERKLLS